MNLESRFIDPDTGEDMPGAGTDRNLFVEFDKQRVLDQFASEQAKEAKYREVEIVRIRVAGDDSRVIERRATEADKLRWHKQWAAYQSGTKMQPGGRAVQMLPGITGPQVAACNRFNVFTIEQLANLSDAGIQQLGLGGQALRLAAQTFLTDAQDERSAKDLRAENSQLAAQIAELRKQVEGMEGSRRRVSA